MSPEQYASHELLRRYFTGAITAPEEAELERRALTDESLAEALRGVQSAPEADHATHVANMLKGARSQVQGKGLKAVTSPKRGYLRWAGVAAAILLLATAVFLLPLGLAPEDKSVAMAEPQPSAERVRVEAPQAESNALLDDGDNDVVSPPASPTVTAPASAPKKSAPVARTTEDLEIAKERLDRAAAIRRQEASQRQSQRRESAERRSRAEAIQQEEAFVGEEMEMEAAPAPAPVTAAPPPPLPLPSPGLPKATSADVFADEALGSREGQYLDGLVTNENGVPIANALVRLPGQPIGEQTDSNGVFRLPANGVARLIEVSHPSYEDEEVELSRTSNDIQISLDRKPYKKEESSLYDPAPGTTILKLDVTPGYAVAEEGFGTLRRRIEENRPADLPSGKYKFSFLVNTDGTLTDFEFRGRPDRAVMDYIGETLVKTSKWRIVDSEAPVRVYFKVSW